MHGIAYLLEAEVEDRSDLQHFLELYLQAFKSAPRKFILALAQSHSTALSPVCAYLLTRKD